MSGSQARPADASNLEGEYRAADQAPCPEWQPIFHHRLEPDKITGGLRVRSRQCAALLVASVLCEPAPADVLQQIGERARVRLGSLAERIACCFREPDACGDGLFHAATINHSCCDRVVVYDDIVTGLTVNTPDMIQKTTENWRLSRNHGA